MACRLPGENDSPEKLWKSILEKQVASGEIPALRWETYHRRDPRNAKVLYIISHSLRLYEIELTQL